MSKISKDKFSKTLSLPVHVWANLEEVRRMTRMPDLNIALQDCIDSKFDSLKIIEHMEQAGVKENIEG